MPKELKTLIMVGVAFFLVAAGLGYFVYDTQLKVDLMTAANTSLETEITTLKAKAGRRETVQAELNALLVNLKEYVKILPSPEIATEEEIIRVFSDYQKRAKLEVLEILAQPPRRTKGFLERSVRFRITGTFKQFVTFLNLIERHENFLQVRSFRISPGGEIVGPDGKADIKLNVNLAVATFQNAGK